MIWYRDMPIPDMSDEKNPHHSETVQSLYIGQHKLKGW